MSAPVGYGRYVGPAILAVMVATLVVIVALALTGRERVVRPEVGDLPIPEGAVVRYQDERCPSPELPEGDDGRVVCDHVLAVTPLEGLWLPGTTEEALADHLRGEGWRPARGAPGWLADPHGVMRVRVESFAAVEARDPDLATAIREGSLRVNEPERLAVMTAVPGS